MRNLLKFFFLLIYSIYNGSIMMINANESVFTSSGVTISIPDNVNIITQVPVRDFTLLNFIYNDNDVFLRAYIGNHPQKIYRDKQDFSEVDLVINQLSGKKWFKVNLAKNIESGEVIIWFKERGWPILIQFWYNDIDFIKLDIINLIIFSVKY